MKTLVSASAKKIITSVDLTPIQSLYENLANVLLDRLDYIKIQPQNVLLSGYFSEDNIANLSKLYSGAKVNLVNKVAELSPKKNSGMFAKLFNVENYNKLTSELDSYAITSASVDLYLANQVTSFMLDHVPLIKEILRVMKVNGCIIISGLANDSFTELRNLGLAVRDFPDMHDIGDTFIAAGFSNPVIDIERMKFEYTRLSDLLQDLKILRDLFNLHNFDIRIKHGVFKRQFFNQQVQLHGKFSVSFEVFSAHAWKDKMVLPEGVKPISIIKK